MAEQATSGRGPVQPVDVRDLRDVWVVLGGMSIVFLGGLLRATHLADAERDVFEAVNHLPDAIGPPIEAVMMVGTLAAVPAVALLALALRRVRLSALLLCAGTLAYGVARVAKLVVVGPRPLDVLPHVDVVVRGEPQTGLGFPSGHSAVSMALVLIVIPYLASRRRWWLLLVPATVGFARMYVGAHLPLDVLGGWGIGAASAFAIHLCFGRPPVSGPGDRVEDDALGVAADRREVDVGERVRGPA